MNRLLYSHRVPELSVVLATIQSFEGIELTVAHLRDQEEHEKIELVIVTSSESVLRLPDDGVEGFAAVRIVEVGQVSSLGSGNAAGVKAATAPLIALAEDHAFPEAGWAGALIEAHRGPWSVVGPVVSNFNPGSAVSQTDFIVGYGLWEAGRHREGKEVNLLPGHHSCYKRDVLLSLGSELEAMLETETVLHWKLHEEGHRLWLEPKARLHHVNFSLWRSLLPLHFHLGRAFAASRSKQWNRTRRLLYAVASPLIPAVRLKRLLGSIRQLPSPGTVIALLLVLATDAVGQFCGYFTGRGVIPQWLQEMEFNRIHHLRRRDRAILRALRASFRERCINA
ncbi:hypothetical protein IAD21_02544 [Abditibacteriota bacterium]|nr:hypothetical protein IAD21_02544 [Abditibacteriota bacterium]